MPQGAFMMQIKHSELYNGKLRLHTHTTDRFKMSRFSINFIVNSDARYSPLYKLMLAVMMRGSEKYPTITDINKALDERYDTTVSYTNARVGDKSIYKISCKLLKNKYVFEGDDTRILDEVLEIVSDILFHPVKDENGLLRASLVESEKRIEIDNINARINDPKSYASEQCSRNMFKGSKYEVYGGNTKLVDSFTPRELTDGIEKFFKECRIECFYVGDESHERILSLVEANFPFNGSFDSSIIYRESKFDFERDAQYIEEEHDISQARLVLGYRCGTVLPNKDYYAMALFNEIFGGGSTSKLFMNVREKKSLCYYCYSSLHSATGTVKVGCGIDPTKKEDALFEIAAQLDAMKSGDFTDPEIETAKRTVIAGLKQINDSPSAIEAYNFRRILAGIEEMPEDSKEKVLAITKDEIVGAAKKVELDTIYFMNGYEEEEYDE